MRAGAGQSCQPQVEAGGAIPGGGQAGRLRCGYDGGAGTFGASIGYMREGEFAFPVDGRDNPETDPEKLIDSDGYDLLAETDCSSFILRIQSCASRALAHA